MSNFFSFLASLSDIQKKIIYTTLGLVLLVIIVTVSYDAMATWWTKPEVASPVRLNPKIDLTKEKEYIVCIYKQKECAYDAFLQKADPVSLCGDRNVCD